MNRKAVLFDFDYTLADSSAGVIESFRYALQNLGVEMAAEDAIRRTIGLPLSESFRTLVDVSHWFHTDEFLRLFAVRADQVVADLTVLYEEVPRVVDLLISSEFSLGIVSTKFRRRIDEILHREGLAESFDIVVGGEDVVDHKPHPEGLLLAVQRVGCSPSEVLYVGDSVTDAETARRASVPFVAVLSGVTTVEEFGNFEPEAILNDLGELPGLVGA